MQAAISQLTLDNSDQRIAFNSHMAKAEKDAGSMKASCIYASHPPLEPLITSLLFFLPTQLAFDKLTVDNADQKTSFYNQMAKANLDIAANGASQAQLSKLTLENTHQRASFDSRMAKAVHDASGMKASLSD